jgi:hypothetical protein
MEPAIRSLVKKEKYEAYTVSYGHLASQRIRDDPRADPDPRRRSAVALVRATVSPKHRGERISADFSRAGRNRPPKQNKIAYLRDHGAGIVPGLVYGALNPGPKSDLSGLGNSYARRALSLPMADRS